MSADTVLGINPGTRFIGIAVMRKRQLVHYEIKSFQGVWSQKKLQTVILYIQSVMRRYAVTKVTVKIPDLLPASLGFTQLVGSLNALCEHRGIRQQYFTFSEVKRKHCKEDKPTGKHLMAVIVRKHPELWLEFDREEKNEEQYYYKVFEAIAVAHMSRTRN